MVADLAVSLLQGTGLDAGYQLSLRGFALLIVGGERVLSGVLSVKWQSSVELVEDLAASSDLELVRVI